MGMPIRGSGVQCMLRTVTIVLLVLAFTSCAGTGGGSSSFNSVSPNSVSLAWDPSPNEVVIGYMIYIGRASGDYYKSYDVGNVLTYTVKNLEHGTYYFTCTAYDTFGNESAYSNEVRTTLY